MSKDVENPWEPQDEGDHYPVKKEWWTIETFFTTPKNHHTWNLMTSFAYELDTPSCFFQYVLFDITEKKCVLHKEINDAIEKLHHKKNRLALHYDRSSLSGLHPNYYIHIEDSTHDFMIDYTYKAQSQPHMVAQDITGGTLPIGLNHYKYGFLPHCQSSGTIRLKQLESSITGKGYLEHAWGNWSYQRPVQMLSGLTDTIATYGRLATWWCSHHTPRIPSHIGFTTENNPYGYDWLWGIFSNGWSLFLGNSLFWIKEGPIMGVLYVTPDGKTYWEFSDVTFQYTKQVYLEQYDIYYPTEIKLKARSGDKYIQLTFTPATESYVYIDPYKKGRFYKAFILVEQPGTLHGTYSDDKTSLHLTGQGKFVPLRSPSFVGHNSVDLHVIKPPNGLGVKCTLDSRFFEKKATACVQLAPKPKIQLRIKSLQNMHQ